MPVGMAHLVEVVVLANFTALPDNMRTVTLPYILARDKYPGMSPDSSVEHLALAGSKLSRCIVGQIFLLCDTAPHTWLTRTMLCLSNRRSVQRNHERWVVRELEILTCDLFALLRHIALMLSRTGYHNMCRWNLFGMLEHPRIRDLQYYARFDTDSRFRKPVSTSNVVPAPRIGPPDVVQGELGRIMAQCARLSGAL